MKIKNTLAFLVIISFCSMASSQITTTSNIFTSKDKEQDSAEYVTVGSIMPYKVSPFNWGSLTPFMNPSIFKWWLNGNATGYNMLKSGGITPLVPLPPPNHVYYPDSSISIQWVKTGKYTIRVNEKSLPKAGITSCDNASDIQTLDVVVADRPTVAWDGSTTKGGCSLDNTTQAVPVLLKGSKLMTITYILVYTPQTGTPDTLSDQTANFNLAKNDTTSSGSIQIIIPQGNFGKYEITITGVTDKIATKCGIAPLPSDFPSEKYTLAVLPALETSPVKFVKELP
jgi:hypothetical protein